MKKQEVLHLINTHAYTNLPKYGFSTDEENAYEIPGKQVCEIINGIVEKDGDQHNVYTLALMCGTGKSSAISLKIREAIEKREGLLVVTDRIKTLEEYTKPEKNKDLADYFKKHKDGFSLMKRENAARIKSTHCKAPVLLMSTQRYFRLSPDEIKEYLEWDGGKRNLVLIDEKPELYTSYKLTKEELRELYDIVEHEAPLSEGKIHFLLNLDFKIKIWFGHENITLDNQGKKKNTFCIINQEENEFDDLTDEEHPDIREPIEADNAYFNSIRELVERKNKNIVDIYDKYNYLRRHRCLMTYRADKDETFITKFRTNSEKLTDIDATVIILDGTADLSIDYYNQEYLHLHTNCKGDVRKLPNLHIRIVNTPGTSREELEKKNDLSIFREYVQAENKEQDSVCVFSYKTIYESFEADEEGEYKEDKLRPYLGNNRSRNDIQYIPVMGQVGVLFSPPYKYIEHMIQQDEEWNKELGEHGKILDDSARIIERLSSEPKYNQLRTWDVLADIEQNIFRCPIRSLQYTGEATYYVFFNCDKHKIIKDAIVRRFGDYYKADVSYVENPLLLDLLNSLKSNKQYAKVLKFLDKQPIYSEFTTQDIMSDPEVNFTKDQFQNARKNRIVDYFLKQFKVNDHKKETTYKKMFDLRDVDKLLK